MATNNSINAPVVFTMGVGGTGSALTPSNGGMVYSTASELAILAGTATAGKIIRSGSSTAPLWSTATYPDTIAQYGMLFSNVADQVSVLPSGGNSCVLLTSLIGKPTWSASMSDGQLVIGRSGNTPLVGSITGSTYINVALGTGSITLSLTGLPFPATIGGTGQSTYATGDILYSSATDTLSKLSGNTTSLKKYLSQTGTGVVSQAPAWSSISGTDVTGAALTKTDDTNVTLTLGGSPTTALLNASSITAGWTGQLGLTRGGSNASLTASNGGIVYSTASAMGILAGTATANQVLLSGSSTTPAWSTTTYPATSATGNIMYASGTNTYANLAPNASTSVVQYLSMINNTPSWFTQNAVNAQSGTTYTVVLSDFGKLITFNNASPITVTLPQQSTTTTSAGFFCWFLNIGAGLVTIVKEGAETLAGNTTLAQNSECKVERPTTTSWSTFGGTATVNFEFPAMATTATANQVLTFTENAACAGTILSVAQAATSFGTAGTYTVAINGSTVTGLSAITNTTSRTITSATAANTFAVGDIITITMGATVAVGVSYIATLVYSRTF